MELNRLFIVTAVVSALTTPAAAQTAPSPETGRAQELAAERNAKAQTLAAPGRSLIERGLHWYDTHGLRLQWRTVHFSGGNFPNGAGLGYGIGISERAMGAQFVDADQPNRIDGSAFIARTTRGYQRMSARMDVLNVLARPIDIGLRWQDYDLPQEDFYGLGMDRSASIHSNYRLAGNQYTAAIAWRPAKALAIGSDLSYLTEAIGAGTDPRYATIDSVYAEEDAPGLSGLPRFVRGQAFLGFDSRDSATHPRRGGHYKATFARFDGLDSGAFDFTRLDVSAQQIIPLLNAYRRIELRAGAAFTRAGGDGAVPFIHQPTIGGLQSVRSVGNSRFRDRNAMWATAEYQWEAWWALDGALFVDAGQVASDRSDFHLSEIELAYGIGFRLHSNKNFIARLDLAYGREGFRPVLGFNYGF